jgi:hypothetical protein
VTSKTEAASEVRKLLQQVKELLADPAVGKVNEATTRAHIITPLLGALGYRGIGDMEFEIYLTDAKTFLDYRLVVDGRPTVSVEAKAVTTSLSDKDGAQAVQYANLLGDKWAIVTNGRQWRLYETFAQVPLAEKLILSLDLVSWESDAQFDNVFEQLWLVSKEAFASSEGPGSWLASRKMAHILRASLTDPASSEVKHIRKRLADQGVAVTPEQIAGWLKSRLDQQPVPASVPAPAASQPSAPVPTARTTPTSTAQVPTQTTTTPHTAPAQPPGHPNHWLVPAGAREGTKASHFLTTWLSRGYWGFWENTPGRKHIHAGDLICFYAAKENTVIARAVADGDIDTLVSDAEWPEQRPPLKPTYKVPLRDIVWLPTPVKIDETLRSQLDAFATHNPTLGWSWFVQTVRKLTPEDYRRVVGE